jgi:Ala-tRNA(Pro) deacylase
VEPVAAIGDFADAARYGRPDDGSGTQKGQGAMTTRQLTTTKKLTRYLDRHGVEYERLPHRRTETAVDEALALGVPPELVAKTIVLGTRHGYVRAVLPASEHLDLHKVRDVLDLHEMPHLLTEEELATVFPSFELGAVPPVGGPWTGRTVVDRRLTGHDTVVVEAGTHSESLRVRTIDILVQALAEVGDICR